VPIVLERGTRKGAPVWMNDSSQTSSAAAMHQQTWQSWGLFWHSLFYVSLLVATGLAISVIPRSWQELSVIMGCALLLGIWYMPYLFISAQTFRQHPWRTLSYMSLGWALWLVLITRDSDYLFVLFGLYPQVSVFLPFPWSLVGGVVLLALSLWQQLPDLGNGGEVVFFFIFSSGVIGICWMLFLNSTFSHNSKQAHLIAQLQAARQELAQAERLAGVMQERQRLAANIHDTVAQGFTSIVMALESVNMSLLANDEGIRPMLERIDRIARESLAETRALLWALQPEVFERASLPEFLLALATRWSEEHGIPVQTMITGEVVALRPEIEVTLLRAAQEALANVWRHAQASSVVLTLSYMDETIVLDVQDDGKGFDARSVLATARAQSTGGFGLPALRERAEQQGGTLTVESEPGEGTTVALTIPAIPTGP